MRLVILTDSKYVLIYLKRMLIAQPPINYLMHHGEHELKIQNTKFQISGTPIDKLILFPWSQVIYPYSWIV
jgi:hypothetical protein